MLKRTERRTVAEIEREIADLERRWPAHSVPPAMIVRLEGLEAELAAARAGAAGNA